MVGAVAIAIVLTVALGGFAWLGLGVGRDRDLEQFAAARSSQSGATLGLSFFASGIGAWALFAPPEVGATAGLVGVVGYAVAVVVPLAALAVLGRRLRRLMPYGHGLIEFVGVRYGRPMHAYVLGISLLYMLVALTAELTAIGGVLGRLTSFDPRPIIIAVAAVTSFYTAYGGLRASLRTDAWQSWLLLALLAVVGVALATGLPPRDEPAGGRLFEVDVAGIEGAATLIIAVVVTTLFHNGYWQRVWAARNQRALARGALLGATARFPIILLAGLVGMLAAASAVDLGNPPVPLFALLDRLPSWVLIAVLALTVALVASSVDTLQNGLAAVVVTERPGIGLTGARVVTVVLMVPAVLVAFQGYSVLRLLLLADLLCAATVVPALLGLWNHTTAPGAISGAVAGLAGAFGYGIVAGGSLAEAVAMATFASGLTFGPFLSALVASAGVTIAVSLARRRPVDVAALGDRVQPLSPDPGSSDR